jgi:PTH1 family peptidyl-tRNA hydrolase
MKIIVGLGNPGFRYRNTRHNAGFMVVKALSKKHHIALKHRAFHGVYGTGLIGGHGVMLFEPRTYMNLSGAAVQAVCDARMRSASDLLVIVDDINLPFGSVRMRGTGSAGGHNGLRSIIEEMGADFARLRLGIKPGHEIEGDLARFVLAPFPRRDKAGLEEMIVKAAACAETWVAEGAGKSMERHNG